MSLIRSNWAKGIKQLPASREANGVVAERFEINIADLPAIVNGDILEIAGLPAYHTLVDYHLDNSDLDSNGAPAVVADIGVMSGAFGEDDAARTCGAELLSASTVFQGAAFTRGALATAMRIAKANTDRGIGIKFSTAPATQTSTGVIALTLFYKQ